MSRAGLNRERVVSMAAELADEHGFDAVTVSGVARAAGIRPPSIYSHLDGAGDLRGEVTTLALRELADRVDRAIAGLATRDALAALGDAHRDYARTHPGRYAAAGALDAPVTPQLAAVAGRHREQAVAVLRGYCLEGDDEFVHAVRLLASTVRGFVDLEQSGAFAGSDTATDESWQRAVDALDAVLACWPPRSDHVQRHGRRHPRS